MRYLAKLRWFDGFECPACGHDRYWLRADGQLLCAECRRKTSPTAGTIFDKTRTPLVTWFGAAWYLTNQTHGANALGLQRVLGVGSYETAWGMLHKYRRAMLPTSGLLNGRVEVDECYIGGLEAGAIGRQTTTKVRVVIAVEQRGARRAAGRVRMRVVSAVSAAQLCGFVEDVVEPGSTIITDAWGAYTSLPSRGYFHEPHNVSKGSQQPHEVLPAVHRVISQVKPWLLGTYQGSASPVQLDHYLNEFCFRFNRRRSGHRGLIFHSLIREAARTPPQPYVELLSDAASRRRKRKVTAAKKRRAAGHVGEPITVRHRNPKRPGGPAVTLAGSPANKQRFIVGGRRGRQSN